MKVSDFESAINSMDDQIVLDEVRIHNGHVTRFHGHIGALLIMWNEKGMAFTTFITSVKQEDVQHDTHCHVAEDEYERESRFDLPFYQSSRL